MLIITGKQAQEMTYRNAAGLGLQICADVWVCLDESRKVYRTAISSMPVRYTELQLAAWF